MRSLIMSSSTPLSHVFDVDTEAFWSTHLLCMIHTWDWALFVDILLLLICVIPKHHITLLNLCVSESRLQATL